MNPGQRDGGRNIFPWRRKGVEMKAREREKLGLAEDEKNPAENSNPMDIASSFELEFRV